MLGLVLDPFRQNVQKMHYIEFLESISMRRLSESERYWNIRREYMNAIKSRIIVLLHRQKPDTIRRLQQRSLLETDTFHHRH